MASIDLKQELDDFVATLPIINENRDYWLIRTQSGAFFETFRINNFVGIEYDEISYSVISSLKKQYPEQPDFIQALKSLVKKAYPNEAQPGLIAGQISKFLYDIKKGDIIVIPSENSRYISIGCVTETPVHLATESEMLKTNCDYTFRKRVKWLKTLDRDTLDPYLYKVLFAHQAINNLYQYSEYIERSLNDFFVKDGEAHLILEIEKEDDIHAMELFALGYGYLKSLDDISDYFKLDISSKEIEVKITLNSPGKLHFKALSWRTVVAFGIVVIAINGGGLKFNNGSTTFDLSTSGIIQKIIDYQNSSTDRQMQEALYQQYKDSLQVKQPEDLVNLLKQSSINKDKAK